MYDFSNIVGHEQVVLHLQNAIKLNKISHAYVINGEKGSGKKLIANTFAKTLQCETGNSFPCGKCRSCVQLETGNNPDVIRVVPIKSSHSIGVDDIREQVNSDMLIKPYASPYKIYIIEEADKLTIQAQNALLKTIEEPPSYAVIILLTTNIKTLLETIESRCVTLELKTIQKQLVKDHLIKKLKVPDYNAEVCATFSQGNIGKAERLASSDEFNEIKSDVIHLLRYIDDMELYEIIEAIKKLSEHKLEINDYIDLMALWYRDVLMLKATKDPNLILYKEEYNYILKHASNISYNGAQCIILGMEKAKLRLNANANFDIVMELMLLNIKENGND